MNSEVVRSIFITNNGLADHIGIAQVLPYLEGLAGLGHELECISVEKPDRRLIYEKEVLPRLTAGGVSHSPLWRSTSVPAQKFERFEMPNRLGRMLQSRVASFKPSLLHCRSYMPLGPVLKTARRAHVPFIFDARGFWIDQRIESGLWNITNPLTDLVVKRFRYLEMQAYRSSAGIVVLTEDARRVIEADPDYGGGAISVIPCSVNFERFKIHSNRREAQRAKYGIKREDLVLAYVGSAGPLYRIDAVYRLMAALKRQGVSVCLLMLGDHDIDDNVSTARAIGCDIERDQIRSINLPHNEVPDALAAADFGLAFLIQTGSSLGVSATKTGEYLACGLPVVSNAGIGDIEEIVLQGQTGWVLADFSSEEIDQAAHALATRTFLDRNRIRKIAENHFDLKRAINKYDDLYRKITSSG